MALRTAESYIDEYEPNTEYSMYYHQAQIERMIDKAREEAIKECADMCDETEDNRFEHKSSILILLNQLK